MLLNTPRNISLVVEAPTAELPDGNLLLFVDFDDVTQTISDSGTISDVSGEGNDLTVTGTPEIDEVSQHRIAYLNGDEYFTAPIDINTSDPATVFAVVRANTFSDSFQNIFSIDNGSTDWAVWFADDEWRLSIGGSALSGPANSVDTEWHVIVAEFDATGNVATLRVDDVEVISGGCNTGGSHRDHILWGTRGFLTSDGLIGQFNALGFYDRLLSAGEKTQIYDYFKSRFDIEGAYYAGEDFITNGGAETGDLTGWTAEIDTMTVRSGTYEGQTAYEGTYFFAGPRSSAEGLMSQEIDISDFATEIDNDQMIGRIQYRGANFPGNDDARMYVEYYDGSDVLLASHGGRAYMCTSDDWALMSTGKNYIPATARTAIVYMHAVRNTGSHAHGFYDNIEYRLFNSEPYDSFVDSMDVVWVSTDNDDDTYISVDSIDAVWVASPEAVTDYVDSMDVVWVSTPTS